MSDAGRGRCSARWLNDRTVVAELDGAIVARLTVPPGEGPVVHIPLDLLADQAGVAIVTALARAYGERHAGRGEDTVLEVRPYRGAEGGG